MIKSILVILFSGVISVSAQARNEPIPSQTKSSQFSWLEVGSARTQAFAANAAEESKNVIRQSLNYPKIEQALLRRYPADVASLDEISLSSNRKIILSRNLYQNVVTDHDGDDSTEVFSANSLLPQNAQVLGISLSPSKNFLVVQVQMNGNIDISRYVIYDLNRKQVTGAFDGLSYMGGPAWNSADELVTMHPDSSPRLTSAVYVDLNTMKKKIVRNHNVYKIKNWLAVTSEGSDSGTLKNHITGETFQIKTHLTDLNAVEESSEAFYYVLHIFTDGTIFRLAKQDGSVPESFIAPKHGYWLSSIKLLGNRYLLVNYSRDSIVTLVVYDLVTRVAKAELTLPDNYDLSDVDYQVNNDLLVLQVANFLGQAYQVEWNFTQSVAPDLSSLQQKFIVSGMEFVSQLEYFTSHDGEKIPARVTRLKLPPTAQMPPAYIETYGAFNYVSGYLTPALDRMKIEFLKRGGILVGTGVRGGAERGYQWYLGGTGPNKANAALDLVAIANGLVAKGYTESRKIVSTGISAGGDNVSLAAQLSPESFGLVIPISGIHDVLDYPQLDRWGPQWYFDYLDPYDAKNFSAIYARAPLELRTPAASYPDYFIVCGENDSRVNKVHSYKLKASLDEFTQSQIHLFSVNNSGHWPQEASLHGVLGVKSNAAIWSRVFDHLGLVY